jgi:hypothetical protein
MGNKRKLSLIGVTLATPALTAAGDPALARTPGIDTGAYSSSSTEASALLKANMLAIAPAEKLRIGGDAILLSSTAPAQGKPVLLAKGSAAGSSNDRTNTDIPECHSPAGATGSGSSASGKHNDRTNTDIPECHSPSSMSGSGSSTSGKHNDRTNTDIPECHSPSSMTGSGSAATGQSNLRTNTDIPECHSPNN